MLSAARLIGTLLPSAFVSARLFASDTNVNSTVLPPLPPRPLSVADFSRTISKRLDRYSQLYSNYSQQADSVTKEKAERVLTLIALDSWRSANEVGQLCAGAGGRALQSPINARSTSILEQAVKTSALELRAFQPPIVVTSTVALVLPQEIKSTPVPLSLRISAESFCFSARSATCALLNFTRDSKELPTPQQVETLFAPFRNDLTSIRYELESRD